MSKRVLKQPSKDLKPRSSRTSTSVTSSKMSSIPSTSTPLEKGGPRPFQLPALSTSFTPKKTQSELEKMMRKTIRRNAPPGEDKKHINQILMNIKKRKIGVQEFISLIGPSTGDGGEVLRSVMVDDLNSFRKLARKVYETITQDSSDVLLNQQMQLSEYYKEKNTLLHDKMMRAVNEIFAMAPGFDFERYAKEKEKYLLELFPIPAEIVLEPEEVEMMKRQAAYHRLQWLRSEGERLNQENNSLKKRLTQLKKMHKEEQMRMMEMEKAAEHKKEKLEETEANKTVILEDLNQSLGKTIIDTERQMRLETDRERLMEAPKKGKGLKQKKSKGAIKKRPAWNEDAAKDIETSNVEKGKVNEAVVAGVKEKFSSPFYTTAGEVENKDKVKSPFRSPPREAEESSSRALPPRLRRSAAPRDSWGGFY